MARLVVAAYAGRMKLRALIAGALVGGGLVVASPIADATRVQACVDRGEFRALSGERLSRREVERRWGVRGYGTVKTVQLPRGERSVVTYPRCGYSPDDAWYGVVYTRKNVSRLFVWLVQLPESPFDWTWDPPGAGTLN